MGMRLERADPVGGTPRCGVGMMSPVGPQTALLWDREQLRAQGSGLGMGGIREDFLEMGPELGFLTSDLPGGW